MHHLEHAEFKMEPLLLPIAKLIVGTQNDIKKACEVLLGEQRCSTRDLLPLIGRDLQQRRVPSCHLRNQSIAQETNELLGKMRWTLPFCH